MKKKILILTLLICNIYVVFAQSLLKEDEFTFSYLGSGTSPCYHPPDNWQTSHGTPCCSASSLLLEGSTIGTKKSEGAFINYFLNSNRKYRIEVIMTEKVGKACIELYAVNNLTPPAKIDSTCGLATFPSITDKDVIGSASGTCGHEGVLQETCTLYFPSNNTFWNPKKHYNQFWVTSNHSKMVYSSTEFIISKITIREYVLNFPNPPENLRATATTGSTITVAWDPPKVTDYPIAKYEVRLNGKLYATPTNTTSIISNLSPCKEYAIQVRTVDARDNYSQPASINAQTTAQDDIVLNASINLSTEPGKRYIAAAENYVLLKPGFSVAATNTQEFFQAKIGCPDDAFRDEFDFMEVSDTTYFSFSAPPSNTNNTDDNMIIYPIEEDYVFGASISALSSDTENDIFIYPNPTSNILTVEYYQFTGTEKMILFDIAGKSLFDDKLLDIISNIDISSFSAGVYFVKVITQDNIFVKKFIKM